MSHRTCPGYTTAYTPVPGTDRSVRVGDRPTVAQENAPLGGVLVPVVCVPAPPNLQQQCNTVEQINRTAPLRSFSPPGSLRRLSWRPPPPPTGRRGARYPGTCNTVQHDLVTGDRNTPVHILELPGLLVPGPVVAQPVSPGPVRPAAHHHRLVGREAHHGHELMPTVAPQGGEMVPAAVTVQVPVLKGGAIRSMERRESTLHSQSQNPFQRNIGSKPPGTFLYRCCRLLPACGRCCCPCWPR